MKTATFTLTCLPGIAATRAMSGQRAGAHTPPRHPMGAARQAVNGPDKPMYFESHQAAPDDGAEGRRTPAGPRVLHIDADASAVKVLAALVVPEAAVTHAGTLAAARALLASEVFSLVVLDPTLPDGDGRSLLPLLASTPLLVYSAIQPEWRDANPAYLAKPWTSARQLWVAIAGLLGIPSTLTAGD